MKHKEQTGFTLLETMVSLAVLLAVSAIVMGGMNQMMKTQGTVANRTEMHTSVRDATEVLEQEIGQAGKISLPAAPVGGWLMLTPVAVLTDAPVTVPVSFSPTLLNANGAVLFDGELLLVDTGRNQETVTLTCGPIAAPTPGLCTTTWTAGPFLNSHGLNVPVTAPGAFSTGVVPPAAGVTAGYAGYANCAPAEIGRATSELQSPDHLVCRLLLEKKTPWRQPAHSLQQPHSAHQLPHRPLPRLA